MQACLGVYVPCSFSYPWSSWYLHEEPFIYWFREGDNIHRSDPVATDNPVRQVKPETQGRFHLFRDRRRKNCSLNIRDARMSDAGVYFFRVERGDMKYSYRDKKLNLQVTGMAGAQERTLGRGDSRIRTGTGHRTTPCSRSWGLGVQKRHKTWGELWL